MLIVRPLSPFSEQFFGSAATLEISARNIFGIVEALDALAGGFSDMAALRAAFAIDGTVQNDWSAPIPANAEVTIFPRVAGGDRVCIRWRTGCPPKSHI